MAFKYCVKLVSNSYIFLLNFSLCKLEDPSAPEPGEHCFTPLLLGDGSSQYSVSKDQFYIENKVQLPQQPCERCVLRWHYRAGTYKTN